MNDRNDIPVLTDLIEKGAQITLSDLGLDDPPVNEDIAIPTDDIDIELGDPAFTLRDARPENYAPLEREVRRILDEHMELTWQEIRLAIQRHLDRP